jgi:hypothetical protein
MAYRNTGQVTGWLTCWSSEIVGGKALNAVSGFGGRGNCAPELLCQVMVSGDGEEWPDGIEDKRDGVEKPFGYFLTRNVACALGDIAAAAEAVQS